MCQNALLMSQRSSYNVNRTMWIDVLLIWPLCSLQDLLQGEEPQRSHEESRWSRKEAGCAPAAGGRRAGGSRVTGRPAEWSDGESGQNEKSEQRWFLRGRGGRRWWRLALANALPYTDWLIYFTLPANKTHPKTVSGTGSLPLRACVCAWVYERFQGTEKMLQQHSGVQKYRAIGSVSHAISVWLCERECVRVSL